MLREHLDKEGQERLDRELAAADGANTPAADEEVDSKILQLRQMGGEVIVVDG